MNIHGVVTREREQRLIPDIHFTCNGSVIKWIVGGEENDRNHDHPELQIWRRVGDNMGSTNMYTKVSYSLLTPSKTTEFSHVYEYTPVPPLDFQEGDILGVYQPDDSDNQLKLYYQENAGPRNYIMSNVDPPAPSEFLLDAAATTFTQLFYPLVTAVISTGNKATIIIIKGSLYIFFRECNFRYKHQCCCLLINRYELCYITDQ